MSRSVGEFTLVGHLGEGSFATVFLARHRESGRDFAMKAISRSRLQGKLQENLESEISILKSFRHVNIVELHDIKKTERHIYLVLEYCRGGDLRALIRRERRLAEPTVRHFMRHLGAGLRFLWSKNLVHRDLKPQNLLLSNLGLDATLKIADFGFARHLAKASMAETICGSPLYMAPEILQGQKYGAKADLWSVGAILYEMLAGRPPFGGANQIQLLANIRRGPTPPPREGFYPLPEDVPRPGRACSELLYRLLVPDPQHRASFREFFHSDVVRPFVADSAGIGAPAAEARRDSLTRSPRGGGQRGAVGVSVTARVAGGDSRVQDLPGSPGGIVRSGHGQQQQQQHRVPVNEPRGVDVQRSPRERGQGRGGWWPLTGWRWGGDGGQQDGPGSRGRGGEDDPRFARLTRTFSDPPAIAHHHQHSRSQTPRSGRDGGGGDAYVYQQGSAARLSRGQIVAAQAQTGPSRPPLTPPSPAHGPSASRRYRAGGALPISVRQHQNPTRRRSESMGGYISEGRGYDDRDTIRRQDTWSPSETGRNDNPSSPWPRSDGGSPIDHRIGGGEVAPPPSRERPRLHSHGPNSAPEMSYMGHAASRARERAAAAAAAAAAGLRGVAFSLAGDRTGPFTPPQAQPAETAREMPPPVAQLTTPRKAGASGSTVVETLSSSGRPSRSTSFDLGARTPTDAAPRGAPVGQLAVTHSHPAAAAAAAGSLQGLGSTSPEIYPLQVAAMVSAQRQWLWGGAGGVMMPAPGDSAIVVGGSGLPYASDVPAEPEVGSGARLGLGAGVRAGVFTPRLEQKESVAQRMQQHQQEVGEGDNRAAESGDGSGGSDDFVMVDGTSSDHVGSPGGGDGGGVRREEMRDAYGTYRIRAPEGEVRGGDASSLGPRLVAAGGRRDRAGSGQAEFGLQPGGAGAVRAAVGEAQGRGEGGRPVPALSLEGVMRCLQVVELFGRRAVLIAQLGDSRLASATQRRWRESLDAQERAGAGGNTWSDAGSLAPVESFAQDPESDIGAFAKDDTSKPSLFTDRDNSWLLSSSSARAPAADPIFRTAPSGLGVGLSVGVGYRPGGINATSSVTGGDTTTGCDSHRLFGEALVLYLKSLSMAKEAIVWGNQALESLPDASSASSMPRNPPATPPPSSPSGKPRAPFASPHSHSPQRRDVSSSGGGMMVREERSRTSLNQHLPLQQSQQRPDPGDSGADPLRSRESGRVGTDGATSSSSGSAGAGRGGVDVTAMGLVPSEAQVAARGALLVGWLTSQFSTVLKRAEKCKLELRGSVTVSSPTTGAGSEYGSDVDRRDAPIPSTLSYSPSSSPSMATTDSRKALVAGSGTAVTPTPPSPGEARHSNPHARGPSAGGGLSLKGDHGAAPDAVAVSARDIVIRAALAQAQDSAASEVLGMWETARKGYEKAAVLLETLLLDALVARPEASVGALGRSGTVSPRRGSASGMGIVSSGGSATLVSGVEGILSEADQRTLQMYMTRFARRAVEVAGIEREEAGLAARGASAGSTERQGDRGQEAVAPPGRRSDGEGGQMSGVNTHTHAPARDSHNVDD